jgi:hypothetical protein
MTTDIHLLHPDLIRTYCKLYSNVYKLNNRLFGSDSQTNHLVAKLDPETGLYLDMEKKFVFYIAHNAKHPGGLYEALIIGITEKNHGRIIGIKYFPDIRDTIRNEINQILVSSIKNRQQ